MKIIVVADTHVQHFDQLPEELINSCKEADAVIYDADGKSFNGGLSSFLLGSK